MDHWLCWRCCIDIQPAPGTMGGQRCAQAPVEGMCMMKRSSSFFSLSLFLCLSFPLLCNPPPGLSVSPGKCCVSGEALNQGQGRGWVGLGWWWWWWRSGLRWVSEISPSCSITKGRIVVPPSPDQSIGQDKSAVRQGWAVDYSGLIGREAFSPLDTSQTHTKTTHLILYHLHLMMMNTWDITIKNRNTTT